MRFKTLLYLLMPLLFIVPSFAQTDALTRELTQFLNVPDVDGAVFWADLDGEQIELAAGQVQRDPFMATTSQHRFYIASSGKMMVAAAILHHVASGQLELDELAWPHINNIEGIDRLENADRVTIRQLLQHTSGLAEYLSDEFDTASWDDPTHQWAVAEALSFAYDEPAAFPPGTDYEYTNTNYVLLGHMLAQLDGSLAQSLDRHIFTPANMTQSTVGANANAPNLARGYDRDGEDASALAWASTLGDGPVVTTAGDLGRFLRALFQENSILEPDMLSLMLQGSRHEPTYGLGVGVQSDEWGTWYGHSGAYDGFEAFERHYPERRATLVILLNGNPAQDGNFLDRAAKILFSAP
ncbi:serine hydrolase domain-containing protein [Maritalea mediterranea]|uniref:Beta-lactamase family protein n=1 Tax=Maritalea mediterranea TaxID=2909667 RepID=A0ABS9E751_9HYPH|nr:serine hydrolase domain-containing protein [Maritalea mediterranea]MCF4098711.1 beta-lactamase family protein [Maritalea mediterranea]